MRRQILLVAIALVLFAPGLSSAWSEKVHTYVAGKAGLKNPEYANLPDLAREENRALLAPLHMHFAAPGTVVTAAYIDRFKIGEQTIRLSQGRETKIRVPDAAGVLYLEIVDLYERAATSRGWRQRYYLLNIAHFIADLSQPLHNCPWGTIPAADGRIYPKIGAWSRDQHGAFDRSLDPFLPPDKKMEEMVGREIRRLEVGSADDLKREVARIANSSIELAARCHAENRQMTKEEALRQVAMSVSLLKAVAAGVKGEQARLQGAAD
jgi:hypothetical protein